MKVTFLLSVVALCTAIPRSLIEMDIYSGRENPKWHIQGEQRSNLMKLVKPFYGEDRFRCDQTSPRLGYKGFRVFDLETEQCLYVVNHPEAENFLLNSFILFENANSDAAKSVYNHVKEVVSKGISNLQPLNFDHSFHRTNDMIGPDNVTEYNPQRWNKYDYVQYKNNCYNYASDYRTDTFAQPGGSKRMWNENKCSYCYKNSVVDGLTSLESKTCPTDQPSVGHYVALVVWPDVDYHYYRKDLDGRWSHKPGRTPVIDYDASHHNITDIDKADIKPYTEICGYLIAVPSKLKLF
ncbi:insoluble matrix shell protein [Acrasis kona]|uniref:Insoluble matrix shell protein n=1 Tax=Acrasis kona TaxID=1008807 RepID=A0AAW2ZFQ1_9EUKA